MIATILNDEDRAAVVIVSYETTSAEIADIVADVKAEYPSEWQYEDIKTRLPKDCEWHTDFGNVEA